MAELSVVVPAYNEESRLAKSLEAILAYLENGERDFEIIVVDDGSSDRTADVARAYEPRGVRSLSLPSNRGKGAALRRGVAASAGDWILLTDADLSTPIEELETLAAHADEADFCFGSRAMPDSRTEIPQPVHRRLMGKVFNRIIRLSGVRGMRDTQCGFKLLRGDPARRVFSRMIIDRFAFDVELLWLARREGLRVAEVGVLWNHTPSSRVRLFTDSFNMFLDVLRFRLAHHKLGDRR